MNNTTSQDSQIKNENDATLNNVPTNPSKENSTSKGLITTIVFLAILAVSGFAFGIYELLQPKSQGSEPKEKSSNDEKVELDWAVKMLAEKYTAANVCGETIFETKYDATGEALKAYIAFINTPTGQTKGTENATAIDYDELNNKYKELFGAAKDLSFINLTVSKGGASFTPDNNSKTFLYQPYGAGCSGSYWLTKQVSYQLNGDDLKIVFDHDVAKYVEGQEKWKIELVDGEIIDFPANNDNSISSKKAQDSAAENILNEYSTRLHRYELLFHKESGKYILSSVSKLESE